MLLAIALILSLPEVLYPDVPLAFIRGILSDSSDVRQQAYYYANAHIIGALRTKAKPLLLTIIDVDPQYGQNKLIDNRESASYTSKKIALLVMAELHDPDLIPIFMHNIDHDSR